MDTTKSRGSLPLVTLNLCISLIALCALFAVQFDRFTDDPGFGWHLASGEWMLEHHAVPRTDPFLAGPSRVWVSDQWLGDLVIALGFRAGGFPLLYTALGVLYVLTFFVLLFRGIRKIAPVALGATLSAFFAFKVGLVQFLLRPVLFAFPILAFVVCSLLRLYRSALNGDVESFHTRVRRDVWLLPLLTVFWANLHPSFVLGILSVLMLLFGAMLDPFFFGERWEYGRRSVSSLGLLLALMSGASILNPNGWALHESIAALGRSEFFMRFHEEWRAPDFLLPEGQCLVFGVFLLVFGVLRLPAFRARIGMPDLMLIGAFTMLSLRSVRGLPFWGIVLAPYLAECWSALIPAVPGDLGHRIRAASDRIALRELVSRSHLLVLLCISMIAWSLFSGATPLRSSVGPSLGRFPYRPLAAMRRVTRSTEHPLVVLADPDFGGFITWHGGGRIRAVLDDRNALLGEEIYKQYLDVLSPQRDIVGFARQYAAKAILLSSKTDTAWYLRKRSDISIIYEDPQWVVFSLRDADDTAA